MKTQDPQSLLKGKVCVQQCGLIINPVYLHLGASPDGLVFDPHRVTPMVPWR